MRKTTQMVLVAGIALSGIFATAGLAAAQTANQTNTCARNAGGNGGNCNNTQTGDNSGSASQEGTASSGSGNAGQVTGVVSGGDVQIDASNRSDNVNVTTGDATASNTGTLDVGTGIQIGSQVNGLGTANLTNVCRRTAGGNGSNCINNQLGDNDGKLDQSANASSGDGIAGQVIGAVTPFGGSVKLVLDNESTDSTVKTGKGTFTNNSNAFVGRGIVIGSTVGP
jgi:hypothetical protein